MTHVDNVQDAAIHQHYVQKGRKIAFALEGLIRSIVRGDGGKEFTRACVEKLAEGIAQLVEPDFDVLAQVRAENEELRGMLSRYLRPDSIELRLASRFASRRNESRESPS